jgi:O-antigen chain-terminating methyltransferase
MATPNAATLTVSAHSFYFDPSHRRPIPPELFRFLLEVEGFTDVEVRSYARSEDRLREDVPAGPIRENVELLNRTLFGDRDYAVIGRAP